MPPLNKELENMIRSDKERGEELIRTMDDNEWTGKKWRQELAPAPLSVRINRTDRDKVMLACAKELGGRGQRALQIIQEFVGFCNLLAAPQNHITKRSGQFAAKQVNIRTEADMTNEMARNLTNLPKYTAYAKILQEGGSRIWIGKIRTLELGATTAGADTLPTFDHVEMRWKVQEDIAERHEKFLRYVAGDNEPPPAVY